MSLEKSFADKEVPIILGVQKALAHRPGVLPFARALSGVGEHALGWMGLAALGALADKKRRAQWVRLGVSALVSHAASVIIKRIVRRPRPHDPRVEVGVGTPSKLSFPSSHSTSTSAAMLALARIIGTPAPLAVVPVMMASRIVLGVHYPTDVATGALLGAATTETMRRMERRA